MKTLASLILIASLCLPSFAQTRIGAYVNPGGGFTPLTGAGSTGQLGYVPPAAYLYVFNGTGWIPWSGTSGGGGAPTTCAASNGYVCSNTINNFTAYQGINSAVTPTAPLEVTQGDNASGDVLGLRVYAAVRTQYSVLGYSSLYATGGFGFSGTSNFTFAAPLIASNTFTNSTNGALNVPAHWMTGTPITGGTATTTKPFFLIEPTGAASAAWSTSGTMFAVNAASGFAGNILDIQTNGVSRFRIGSGGQVTFVANVSGSGVNIAMNNSNMVSYATATNCSSAASPAVCGSAAAGTFVVAAAATAVTVNTTQITANSEVFLQEDSSLGTKLSVTCNTTAALAPPTITARTAGTSFAVLTTAPTTNPRCFSYHIIN